MPATSHRHTVYRLVVVQGNCSCWKQSFLLQFCVGESDMSTILLGIRIPINYCWPQNLSSKSLTLSPYTFTHSLIYSLILSSLYGSAISVKTFQTRFYLFNAKKLCSTKVQWNLPELEFSGSMLQSQTSWWQPTMGWSICKTSKQTQDLLHEERIMTSWICPTVERSLQHHLQMLRVLFCFQIICYGVHNLRSADENFFLLQSLDFSRNAALGFV
jgi:hypothetical protein